MSGEKKMTIEYNSSLKNLRTSGFWVLLTQQSLLLLLNEKSALRTGLFFKPWTHGCYARSFMRRINLVKRIGTKPLAKCLMILQK